METQNQIKARELATNLMGGDDRNIQPIIDCLLEAMEWKDEQYDEERKELLELVKMIPVNEGNQTIVEDLINILEL